MNDEQLIAHILLEQSGELESEAQARLDRWRRDHPETQALSEQVHAMTRPLPAPDGVELPDLVRERIRRAAEAGTRPTAPPARWRLFGVAAAAAAIVLGVVLLGDFGPEPDPRPVAEVPDIETLMAVFDEPFADLDRELQQIERTLVVTALERTESTATTTGDDNIDQLLEAFLQGEG